MFGNASGIAFSSFINRFKKKEKSDERSNIPYELSIMVLTIIFLPIALVHAIISKLIFKKVI